MSISNGLIILRGSKSKTSEFNEIRLEIINAITGSKPSDLDSIKNVKFVHKVKVLRMTF